MSKKVSPKNIEKNYNGPQYDEEGNLILRNSPYQFFRKIRHNMFYRNDLPIFKTPPFNKSTGGDPTSDSSKKKVNPKELLMFIFTAFHIIAALSYLILLCLDKTDDKILNLVFTFWIISGFFTLFFAIATYSNEQDSTILLLFLLFFILFVSNFSLLQYKGIITKSKKEAKALFGIFLLFFTFTFLLYIWKKPIINFINLKTEQRYGIGILDDIPSLNINGYDNNDEKKTYVVDNVIFAIIAVSAIIFSFIFGLPAIIIMLKGNIKNKNLWIFFGIWLINIILLSAFCIYFKSCVESIIMTNTEHV